MEQKLGIDVTRQNVVMGDTKNPINFGEVLQLNPEYKIQLYSFQGEKGIRADGCVFEVQPFGSTTVMRVTDESVTMQDIAIKGSGWFLGVDPDGEMVIQEVGDHLEENPLVNQRKGWVGVWIAGNKGLEVLDVTEPPFNPSMESEVTRTEPSFPTKFWEQYDLLRTPTNQ